MTECNACWSGVAPRQPLSHACHRLSVWNNDLDHDVVLSNDDGHASASQQMGAGNEAVRPVSAQGEDASMPSRATSSTKAEGGNGVGPANPVLQLVMYLSGWRPERCIIPGHNARGLVGSTTESSRAILPVTQHELHCMGKLVSVKLEPCRSEGGDSKPMTERLHSNGKCETDAHLYTQVVY